jgi:hypothetical protein
LAERRGSGKKKSAKQHRIVEQIVADPAAPPDAVVLTGFPGASDREGHRRLYLTPELSSYVDIAEADVLHEEELPREQSPLEAHVLWVRGGATLRQSERSSRDVQAEFLQGPVAEQHLAEADPGLAAMGAAQPMTTMACVRVTIRYCLPISKAVCGSLMHCTEGCSVHCPSDHCATRNCPDPGVTVKIC